MTSLIDGFYFKTKNAQKFESYTLTNQMMNSNHHPVTLKIPQNTLRSRTPLMTQPSKQRIPNVINREQLQTIQTKFITENKYTIAQLTKQAKKENTHSPHKNGHKSPLKWAT
jgi:hypothetical protein